MMSDLNVVDFLLAAAWTAATLAVLVWLTRPRPVEPVNPQTINRIRIEQEERQR